jgi:hypothetical protein
MKSTPLFSRMPHIIVAAVCVAATLAGAADKKDSDWRELTAVDGTKSWRLAAPKAEGVAEWRHVGDIRLAPKNHRLLQEIGGRGGIIMNGKTGRTKNIISKIEHGDVEAHIEFLVAEKSNSGIYFMGRYEIQVLDSFGKDHIAVHDCGAIYQRWDPKRGKGKEGYEGHTPRVNASRKAGEWQSFDVIFRAPQFDKDGKKTRSAEFVKVVHNGAVIHENVKLTGPTRGGTFNDEKPTGPFMLQGDHGPVAYRNIRFRPLK